MRLEPSSYGRLLNCNAALSVMIGDVSLQIAKQMITVSTTLSVITSFLNSLCKLNNSIGR